MSFLRVSDEVGCQLDRRQGNTLGRLSVEALRLRMSARGAPDAVDIAS